LTLNIFLPFAGFPESKNPLPKFPLTIDPEETFEKSPIEQPTKQKKVFFEAMPQIRKSSQNLHVRIKE